MIKIDDALANVAKLGFDTAPLIYFVERNPNTTKTRDRTARVEKSRRSLKPLPFLNGNLGITKDFA